MRQKRVAAFHTYRFFLQEQNELGCTPVAFHSQQMRAVVHGASIEFSRCPRHSRRSTNIVLNLEFRGDVASKVPLENFRRQVTLAVFFVILYNTPLKISEQSEPGNALPERYARRTRFHHLWGWQRFLCGSWPIPKPGRDRQTAPVR